MEPIELFTKAAEKINGSITISQNNAKSYVTIALPEGRKHGVHLSLVQHRLSSASQEKTMVHVDSLVGPMNDTIDPEYLLECMRDLAMARIAFQDASTQLIALEGRLPLDLTTPELLACLMMETASCADALEHTLFGVDMY